MSESFADNEFRWGNILCVPVVHSRYYFALRAQEMFDRFRPELVAVEFPQALKELLLRGVRRLPYLSVVCSSPDGENYSYVPVDPCDALIHSVRLGVERGAPVHFVDLNRFDLSNRIMHYTPDDYSLPRIGADVYYEKTMEKIPLSEPGSVDYMREQHMAARLRHLNCLERRVLFVCGMIHWERVRGFLEAGGGFEYFDLEEPEADSFLANLHPDSAKEVLEEIPAVAGAFETARKSGAMDRNEQIGSLIAAADSKSPEPLPIASKISLMKYLRNLSLVSMQFTPDLVDLLTAAKNICGNEFALNLMEIAEKYPYTTDKPDDEGELPTIIIRRTFTESDEGRIGVKSIRLRRRQNMVWKRNLKRVVLKKKPPERFDGEWQLLWQLARQHVSHTPEDIRLEDYNQFIRNKVMKVLSEERARTVEFTTSMLDGIDMRETIRNAHTGKIFVRDVPFIKGRVGPVVVVFDDEHPEKYPFRTAWYSEFDYESDLLMYTTPPGDYIIGPGISQCRFGGFASIYPPRMIPNYWMHYEELKQRGLVAGDADLLLYCAIDNADEKYIAYVAQRAPSRRLKQLAESKGKHIVFIPISTLGPDSVEKLRRFHVLGDKRLRGIAHKYIF